MPSGRYSKEQKEAWLYLSAKPQQPFPPCVDTFLQPRTTPYAPFLVSARLPVSPWREVLYLNAQQRESRRARYTNMRQMLEESCVLVRESYLFRKHGVYIFLSCIVEGLRKVDFRFTPTHTYRNLHRFGEHVLL